MKFQKTVIFVDGYNVLNAWPETKAILEEDLEGAREKLIDHMIEYAAYYGEEVYLVYDAYLTDYKKEKIELIQGVHVVYTKENQTADAFIEREVNRLSEDVRIIIKVVTSDWVQQRQILGSGGLRLTPWELKEKCVRIRKKLDWARKKEAEKESEATKYRSSFKKLANLFTEQKK